MVHWVSKKGHMNARDQLREVRSLQKLGDICQAFTPPAGSVCSAIWHVMLLAHLY